MRSAIFEVHKLNLESFLDIQVSPSFRRLSIFENIFMHQIFVPEEGGILHNMHVVNELSKKKKNICKLLKFIVYIWLV